MNNSARFLAYKIIKRFDNENSKLDQIIDKIFIKYNPEKDSKYRAKVIANEVIRYKGRLDLMIEYISGRSINNINNEILSILRLGFYEITMDRLVPDYAAVDSAVKLAKDNIGIKATSFINAVLRNLTRKNNKDNSWTNKLKNKAEWNSLPFWIQNKWKKNLGEEEFLEMVKTINTMPPNFIRLDTNQNNIDEVKQILGRVGIKSKIFSSSFLKIFHGFGKIFQTDLFKNGNISIQNPASAAIVDCLEPNSGDTVLDVCAAPGTKSLYLANIVGKKGLVLASDIIPKRINNGILDIKRHGKQNIKWSLKDASKDTFPMVERILIDAPCTGTGIIARKPDIRWRRQPKDFEILSKKQLEILLHCSKFLKPNGILVYATCSMEPEENWNVVEQFLKLNTDFLVDNIPSKVPKSWIDNQGALSTLPYLHGVDGMFAAKLKRKK